MGSNPDEVHVLFKRTIELVLNKHYEGLTYVQVRRLPHGKNPNIPYEKVSKILSSWKHPCVAKVYGPIPILKMDNSRGLTEMHTLSFLLKTDGADEFLASELSDIINMLLQ